MSRLADLQVVLGPYPSGRTGSVLDVPGCGLGHATVRRDEEPPPVGRGIARTGVTVLDPGGDLFTSPVPMGGAILNGAGECTGFITGQEWGLAESPIFLTSTMQLGRVYDAACELLMEEQPAIGSDDVIIPIVAECDDSFLNDTRRMQVTRDDVRAALAEARASAGGTRFAEGAVGAGTGMSCLGYKGGIGTASRVLPDGHTVGVLTMTNFGERGRLTVAGVPAGRLLPDPTAPGEPIAPPAGSCIVVVLTDAPLDSAACRRLAKRAGLGLARTGSTAHHASGEIFLALATGLRVPRGTAPAHAPLGGRALDPYFAAVVDATEEAVLNSLLQAETVTGRDGNTSHALPAGELAKLLG
ncbi:P1 family peptidase [Streptosporangium sp. NPDC005286]|uniref:P1 family peptidase n=1 Tax=Streptosporangium sp. NPDC005286 TaxID=3154463 RepID=UPI0033AB34BB